VLAVAVHVGPDELVRSDGTNTLKLPDESVYRYGSSSVTGQLASVV